MEGDGKVESAFWNPFFNYKKSSTSAFINLRLRALPFFNSLAGMILFQVWPC